MSEPTQTAAPESLGGRRHPGGLALALSEVDRYIDGANPYSTVHNVSEDVLRISWVISGAHPDEMRLGVLPSELLLPAGVPANLAAIADDLWQTRLEVVQDALELSQNAAVEYAETAKTYIVALNDWAVSL